MYRQEVNSHVETMQNDLDNLRDMLRGENYSIDANAILGVNVIIKYFFTYQ